MKNGGAMNEPVENDSIPNGPAGDSTRAAYRLARIACPLLCAACLAGGLALAGQGLAAVAALLFAAALLLNLRRNRPWQPTAALVALTALAAYGLLSSAAALLMLAGAAAALAAWDLALAEITRPAGFAAHAGVDFHRLRLLALALGAGLLAAAVGVNIQFQLPFIALILLVGLAIWALERIFKSLV